MIASLLAAALLFTADVSAEVSPPCTIETSTPASVVEIAGDPDRFLDRCVTVSGAVAGISIYSGREGMYLAHRFGSDGNYSEEGRRHRIGIDRQDIRDLRMAYPQQATVTGRVDSCERRYKRIADAGGIAFLAGYCHYHSGPTIVVDSYSITEKRHERLIGEAARADFGDLAFMPSDWPARAGSEAVVADFLAAVRRGDRARLAELHDFTDTDNEHRRGVLYALLQDAESPFTALRQGEAPQSTLFVSMAEDGTLFGREGTAPGGLACFCRTEDCTGLWPIALNDANNARDRPFVCTHLQGDGSRPAWLVTPVGGGWLMEPAASAAR